MAQHDIDINLRTRVTGESQLDRFNAKVREVKSSMSGLNFVMRAFGLASLTYLGGRIISGFINQQEELAKSLGRTRFFLGQYTGGVQQGLEIVNKYADTAQSAGLAQANLAREIGAKALVAFKEQTKALRVANTVLVGHRLNLLDANAAMNAMVDASNGNTEALRTFLAAMGVAAPEFASFETLVQNLIGSMEGAEKELTGFSREWQRFLGNMKVIGAAIGGVFADLLRPVFGWLNDALEALIESSSSWSKFWSTLVDGMKEAGSILWDNAKEFMYQLWRIFVDGLDAIGQLASIFWENKVVANFAAAWEIIKQNANAVWNFLVNLFMNVFVNPTITAFKFLADMLLATWNILWKTISAIGNAVWTVIRNVAVAIWSSIASYLGISWEGIAESFKKVWQGIKEVAKSVWDSIVKAITSSIDTIIGKIQGLIDSITNAINKIKEFASVQAQNVIQSARSFVGKISPFQEGGIVTRPTLGMVGEAGPEAIIPLSQMGGMGTNITITGNTFMTDEEGANRIGDLIIRNIERVHRFGLSM